MPPRLSKRQQREQGELSALALPPDLAGELGEDDAPNLPLKPQIGAGFAALSLPEAPSDDDSEGNTRPTKARKPKRKKKKPSEPPGKSQPTTLDSDAIPQPSQSLPMPHRNEKKPPKKSKGKDKKTDNDDIDKVLAELSIKYPDLQRVSSSKGLATSTSSKHKLSTLLSVSLPHLDSEGEMRRFFGAKVVSQNAGSSASSRRQPGAQRSHLAHVQPNWWPAAMREGLTISMLNNEDLERQLSRHSWTPVDEERWWRVEYSKKYKSITSSFMRVVAAGDPEGFWSILQKLPWHADTLLQLSEVYRYREEYSQAVDFVERALFTYERCFVGAFNFTTGLNRLDFDHVENRPFFLAVHRQVTDLQRRGCVRTAFEFARLLYSLDPWTDPYGALFHLDYLAIKAGMNQWLLDLSEYFTELEMDEQNEKNRINPTLLPGWNYARALALWISEDSKKDKDHEASTTVLEEAIRTFPAVVPLLADKLDISLPAHISSMQCFRIQTNSNELTIQEGVEHILSHVYATRSSLLWKDPAHAKWLSDTVTNVCSSGPPNITMTDRRRRFLELYTSACPTFSVYRHIVAHGDSFRRLTAFLPAALLQSKVLTCDPLPPPTYTSTYDDLFFSGTDDPFAPGTRTRQERAAEARILQRLVPDQFFRAQLEALFNANPHLAERFPGGLIQLVQAVIRMSEEEIDQLLVDHVGIDEAAGMEHQDAVFDGDRHGVMPGEMPDDDDAVALQFLAPGDELRESEDEIELPNAPIPALETAEDHIDAATDSSEEDESIAPMPVRLLRNFINRIWGRPEPSDSSEDDEGAGDVMDVAGVD